MTRAAISRYLFSCSVLVCALMIPACGGTDAVHARSARRQPTQTRPASSTTTTTTTTTAAADALAREVVTELNRLRANPPAWTAHLRTWRAQFRGNLVHRPGNPVLLRTQEGVAAVDEAIAALQNTPALAPLSWADGLARAAADHAREQAASGALGHRGADGSGPSQRVNRYGRWDRKLGETIDYGRKSARAVIRSLIIDDGVASRGHRTILLHPDYRVAGAACAGHPRYGQTCVIDFAGAYR